jgi:hypothetical protein
MVATLSRSSAGPYIPDMPMQPSPAERPLAPPCPVDEVDDVVPMSSLDARSSGFSWQEGTREFYTSHRGTMPARGCEIACRGVEERALVREILERVADKWTLLVIDALEGKSEVRFSRLRERIGGVSQKMGCGIEEGQRHSRQ